MEQKYFHRVLGLYPSRTAAEHARNQIQASGIPPTQIRLLKAGLPEAGAGLSSDSDDVLKQLLRDAAMGGAVGTAVATGVTIALAVANMTLFIANPMLSALYALGWGSGQSGTLGAVAGSARSNGDVAELIKDALACGQVVLLVFARSEAETGVAQDVLGQHQASEITPPHLDLGRAL